MTGTSAPNSIARLLAIIITDVLAPRLPTCSQVKLLRMKTARKARDSKQEDIQLKEGLTKHFGCCRLEG